MGGHPSIDRTISKPEARVRVKRAPEAKEVAFFFLWIHEPCKPG